MQFRTLRRLFGLILPFWRGIAFSVLLGVLTIGSSVSLMATSAWMISKAGLQPSIADLGVAVVAVRFFGIARGVFRYLERLVSHETTFRLLAKLRVTFYKAIEPLAPARLSTLRSGDLLARVVGDVENLQNIYLRAAAPPLVALLVALLLTVFFAAFNPFVALVAFTTLVMTATAVPLLGIISGRKIGQERVATASELNAALVDHIQGLADSLAFGRAQAELAELENLNRRLAGHEMQFAHLDGWQNALLVLLTNGAAVAVLAVAIPRIDGIFLGTLALATIAAFEAVVPLGQAAFQLGTNISAAGRIFDIIDSPPAVSDPAQPLPLSDDYNLSISHLSFRYPSTQVSIIENLNLTLEPGQRIAVLGTSGSGKSTLVNLLVRFWDYDSGSIRLGNHELREYAMSDVRWVFGVMSQRTHLFNTSIRENIRIARPDATEADIVAAAHSAQIHDFIRSLPDGYNTLVGENGLNLSGGERQRIALARVLVKNAPILILDEATTNLDTLTERAILETVYAATAGHSLLVFTHRPVLLDRMDAVYVLKEGHLETRAAQAID